MKNFLFIIISFLFNSNISSLASTSNISSDILKNAVTFSQNRLGYNNCAIKYNSRLNPNWWFKVGLVADGDYRKNEPKLKNLPWNAARELSYGIIIGFDKHSLSTKGFSFVYGPHILFSYINQKYTTNNPLLIVDQRTIKYHFFNAGIGFTIGFYYNINDRFAIGSELNPYVAYKESNNTDESGTTQKGYEFDIFGNASIISLRYKW